ncbi:hypothetical protein NS228_05645 [Methylobacterium indicum]|uniref:Uncharacterized protein n=1 Tax=Methylobacterium indicum TaxID=1775910 RepID=A0ABR5H990_9HYPH|nr:hypothetical protein [Methylobacterium indicum]KMO10212.1 hypothetical protein QR78_30460 [Methylobacterium indicum]KMO21369.1 hypothetical protein QR79_16935 [Methylobacterium indicum]KTS19451.1 hypothetical protein NS229_25680 [Methylobacterium indicum]KTS41660.1 hypothetical protein NS228_05645 [Methylobacterium indicum]KTS45806.1 hypothetical protein NS230_23160 [Methylobacterium indicum]
MGHSVRLLAGAVLLGLAGPAMAADLPEPGYWPEPRRAPGPPPAPRYFPRGDSDASPARVQLPCQGFVPTNALGDPTYVGSPFGLGKPSYYGFPPPRGVDDPYGRRLARGCW